MRPLLQRRATTLRAVGTLIISPTMSTPSTKGTRGRTRYIGLIVVALLAAGCKKRDKPGAATTTSATQPAATIASHADENSPPAALAEGPPPLLAPLLKFLPADGLRGPASVIHDEASDVYLLSNMDGSPAAADGKGFISKLSPDGKKILTRWIESGKNNVVLNAPKGMALRGDELYVADIDTVRIFHRGTGAPLGEVQIPGSKFLADVTVGPDGGILVSDAGLKANAKGDGLEESGTDAVYVIYRDRRSTNISLVAKAPLAGPTGLFATRDKILVGRVPERRDTSPSTPKESWTTSRSCPAGRSKASSPSAMSCSSRAGKRARSSTESRKASGGSSLVT